MADNVAAAVLVIARHVPEQWPRDVRCRRCRWPYPCAPVRLANAALVHLGVLDRPVILPAVWSPGQVASGSGMSATHRLDQS